MKYLLTTTPGFEDIAINEIKEKLNLECEIFNYKINFPGKIFIETNKKIDFSLLDSISRIFDLIDTFEFNKIDDILNKVKKSEFNLKNTKSFKVTCQRKGHHDFNSVDIQKKTSEIIYEKYKTKGDMKNFEIEIIFEIYENICIMLKGKRKEKRQAHIAATKPEIAYSMLRLIDGKGKLIDGKRKLLDPFTGYGTIAIQAAKMNYEVSACDISNKYIEIAKQNAKNQNLSIDFKKADATTLDTYDENYFDVIICNPPYGIKINCQNVKVLYEKYIRIAYKVLKKYGTLVLMTNRAEAFRIMVLRSGLYFLEQERVVGQGTFKTTVFVLRKLV